MNTPTGPHQMTEAELACHTLAELAAHTVTLNDMRLEGRLDRAAWALALANVDAELARRELTWDHLTVAAALCGHDPRLEVILAALIEGNREWDTLEQLAAHLTTWGWQCTAPGVARTWPVTTVPEDELTHARARRDDRATSKAGAAAVAPRAGSQRARLLAAYASVPEGVGLTDEQAADLADLSGSCYWKRCGELRDGGHITWTGTVAPGSAGVPRIRCVITPAGRALHATLNP